MWPASRRLCRALWRDLAAAPGRSGARTLVTRRDEDYDALLHGARARAPACGGRAAGPEPQAPRHPSEPAAPAGAFSYGSVAPRVVPFQVSLTEAQRAFERWQQAHWLAPGRVLRRGHTEMRALLLPFWLFEAAFQVEFTGAPRRRPLCPSEVRCRARRAGSARRGPGRRAVLGGQQATLLNQECC